MSVISMSSWYSMRDSQLNRCLQWIMENINKEKGKMNWFSLKMLWKSLLCLGSGKKFYLTGLYMAWWEEVAAKWDWIVISSVFLCLLLWRSSLQKYKCITSLWGKDISSILFSEMCPFHLLLPCGLNILFLSPFIQATDLPLEFSVVLPSWFIIFFPSKNSDAFLFILHVWQNEDKSLSLQPFCD